VKLRRYIVVLSLVAAGLLAAACGGASSPAAPTSPKPTANPDTAAKIVPAMQAAVASASSVHIAGTVLDGSQHATIDMSFVGGDVSGTLSEGSQSYTLLVVSGKAYFKVDQAFLQSANPPASDCSSMCGKYVAVPGAQLSQLTGSLSMSSITQQFVKSLPSSVSHDTADLFVPATLNGQPVLQFTQSPYTIDVAATGAPYLLYAADASQGTLTFSQWNSVPPLTPPPAGDVITL